MVQAAAISSEIRFVEVSRPYAATRSAVGSAAVKDSAASVDGAKSSVPAERFTSQEQRLLARLKETDRSVRAHEQAHIAAGAGLVRGGATFSSVSGPDHQRYAVGGEVSIDISPAATAQETVAKARQIRAAALAPADPSAQDQRVAALATSMESAARVELSVEQRAAFLAQHNGAHDGAMPKDGRTSLLAYRAVAQGVGAAPGGGLDVYA